MADRSYIPMATVDRVRSAARERCGYCRAEQWYLPVPLELEHLIPVSRGGTDDEVNLWLACGACNTHKSDRCDAIDPETGDRVPLFNLRMDRWAEHFRWSGDRTTILGLTPAGRATAAALQFNTDPRMIRAREAWVSVGWYPPRDDD